VFNRCSFFVTHHLSFQTFPEMENLLEDYQQIKSRSARDIKQKGCPLRDSL